MSHAIAQTTNALTVSPVTEQDYPFEDRVLTLASRQSKGITRERINLNKQSLVDSLRNDYRCHYASIYGKGERIPSNIEDKLRETVGEFLKNQLARVNEHNVIGVRRAFHWKEKDSSVVDRITVTGENQLSLEEQRFGIITFIEAAQKRLKTLEDKKTPDYESEKELKNRIVRLNNTKLFIENEIQHQQEHAKKA